MSEQVGHVCRCPCGCQGRRIGPTAVCMVCEVRELCRELRADQPPLPDSPVPATAPSAPPLVNRFLHQPCLSVYRCKVCGTRWLLWPDAVRGGVWNLLDCYQRPGPCCDNAPMGGQIEHLRDLPLTSQPIAPPADPLPCDCTVYQTCDRCRPVADPLPVPPDALREIGAELVRQDNASTAQPLFVVQQRHRIYGLDPQWSDDVPTWITNEGDCHEADEETAKALEAEYQSTCRERDGWTRTRHLDTWEFVTACLTRAAAERFIGRQRHNLKDDPRVYVESGYRNDEWIALRAALKALADPLPVAERLCSCGHAIDSHETLYWGGRGHCAHEHCPCRFFMTTSPTLLVAEAGRRTYYDVAADAYEALARIVRAYDRYRGRGVIPAPDEYQGLVGAIDAARSIMGPQFQRVESGAPADPPALTPETQTASDHQPSELRAAPLDGVKPERLIAAMDYVVEYLDEHDDPFESFEGNGEACRFCFARRDDSHGKHCAWQAIRSRASLVTVPHVEAPAGHQRDAEMISHFFRPVPLSPAEKLPDPDFGLNDAPSPRVPAAPVGPTAAELCHQHGHIWVALNDSTWRCAVCTVFARRETQADRASQDRAAVRRWLDDRIAALKAEEKRHEDAGHDDRAMITMHRHVVLEAERSSLASEGE